MKKFLAFLAVIASALLLASCGGGGGSPGVTGPTNELRMTPSLSGVSMVAGTFSDVATISHGVSPYYVISSAPAADARILSDGTLRIFGYLPGSATVTVQDSSIPPTSLPLDVTVKALPPLYTDPDLTGGLELGPGVTFYFTVHGGMPPYVVSGTSSVFRVSCVNPVGQSCPDYYYSVTASSSFAGTGSIVITDQYRFADPPDLLNISVTVKTPEPMMALAVAPTSLTGRVGTTATAMVMGGVSPYQVASSNPGVASASVSGSTITVNFLTVGASVITVVDSTGKTVTLNVTATGIIPALTVSPGSGTLGNPDGTGPIPITFTISGGTSPYTAGVTPAGAPYITATVSGTTLTVTRVQGSAACIASGGDKEVPVAVTDNNGQTISVGVSLTHNTTIGVCP
ncbi:MAG: hypothetical protein LBI48_07745 [Burkholderiaceae bacterium]|jgi:hypothetical protein|nr:hypothetical protein [Burkholderiaceae bacterium]